MQRFEFDKTRKITGLKAAKFLDLAVWLTGFVSFGLVQDVSSSVCSGSGSFVNIPGLLSMIEVATDGSVYGVNSQGSLFKR